MNSDHDAALNRGSMTWTPELVQRFWDWQGTHADISGYFTHQVPDALLSVIQGIIPRGADILDFGCGLGLLGRPLMENGYGYIACDASTISLGKVEERLSSHTGWRGTASMTGGRLSLPDATVDAIIIFEALEHLLDDQLAATCRELYRVIRPGGRLLVTVPNEERLPPKMVFCPTCKHSFHRMQHQRSFDRTSLATLLEGHGFRTSHCLIGDLVEVQSRTMRNPLRWSVLYLGRRLHLGWGRLLARLTDDPAAWLGAAFPGQGPHLVWSGRRR